MEIQAARRVVDMLAQGIHPATGERMPPDSPYIDPEVIAALHAVSEAAAGRPRRPQPPNAGKAWAAADDQKIEAAFAAGIGFGPIAEELGRTPFAVQSRLVKLGKLPPQPGMRVGAPG